MWGLGIVGEWRKCSEEAEAEMPRLPHLTLNTKQADPCCHHFFPSHFLFLSFSLPLFLEVVSSPRTHEAPSVRLLTHTQPLHHSWHCGANYFISQCRVFDSNRRPATQNQNLNIGLSRTHNYRNRSEASSMPLWVCVCAHDTRACVCVWWHDLNSLSAGSSWSN